MYGDNLYWLSKVSRDHIGGECGESIACGQHNLQVEDSPWLWSPGQTSREIQNRCTNGPSKITYNFQNKIKKENNYKYQNIDELPSEMTIIQTLMAIWIQLLISVELQI